MRIKTSKQPPPAPTASAVGPCLTIIQTVYFYCNECRKENSQKLTQLSSRSHPRHLVGKRTAQKDTIIDITSDSQVNSNFPCRWSTASLTFNNYFLPIFIFIYNVNNHKQQRATSKITKEPKQKSRLGTAGNKNYWGASTSPRSTNPRP